MKRTWIGLGLILGLAVGLTRRTPAPTPCTPCAPQNLTIAKHAIQDYYESGAFERELKVIIAEAKAYFEDRKHDFDPISKRQAVVFDVDETLLFCYDDMKDISFGYVPKMFHEWVMQADTPVLGPVRDLYLWFQERGFHTIILTGRRADEAEATRTNLALHGISGFDELIVRDESELKLHAQEYKSARRADLARRGYDIVASVGDQWSDLYGGYSGKQIKIPNYLYIIY